MEQILHATSVKTGPRILSVMVLPTGSHVVRELKYEAKDDETTQALMMRAANDITEGIIVDIRFSRGLIVNTEEQQALIDQTVAVL